MKSAMNSLGSSFRLSEVVQIFLNFSKSNFYEGFGGDKVMSWDPFEATGIYQGKNERKVEQLTAGDLDFIDGRRDLLESLIQQRYGFAPDYVRKEIDDWFRWQDSGSPCLITPIMNHRSDV